MKHFNEHTAQLLNESICAEPQYVESVRLSSFGFDIQFVDIEIHCTERVFAQLDGKQYEWSDAPSSAPWGLFGRQKLVKCELKSNTVLRLIFESSDHLDIEMAEHEFESVIIKYPPLEDGTMVWDIY